MAIVSIPGITLENGEGARVDLSVVEAKTMRILRTKDIGTLITATAQNPGQIKGGTAVFRNTRLIQVGNYNPAGRAGDTPTVASVSVNLDQRKDAKREIETFDMAGLETAAEIEAIIADGMALSIAAHKDAVLLKAMYEVITAAQAAGDTQFTIIPGMHTSTDKDTNRLNRLRVSDIVADMTGTINMEMVGTDKEEVIVWTNRRIITRLIDSLTVSHTATEKDISGILDMTAGIALAEHKFIGKDIPLGSSFDKDTEFLFSNIHAMIVHTEAMAMPFNMNSLTMVMNPATHNPVFMSKFQYGLGTIRPTLVHAIVEADPATVLAAQAKATAAAK